MAGTLQITDGTTTINLLNTGTGLYLDKDGWRPTVAIEDENGDYLDMVETIRLTWNEVDDNTRAETLKDLMKLARKARRYVRRRLVSDYVWIEASTHSETDTRYAIIKDIQIPDGLSADHWAANGPVTLTIVVTHMLWMSIAPNGTPTTAASASNLRHASSSSWTNYVTIPASSIKGDAPALTIIVANPQTNNRRFFHTRKGSTTELNGFKTFLNVNDDSTKTFGTKTADSDLPGGYYYRMTNTGASFEEDVRLIISASDVLYFLGRYQVYLFARASADNEFTVSYDFGFQASVGSQNTFSMKSNTQFQLYNMGQIDIASEGLPADMAVTTENYEFEMNIEGANGMSGTFDYAGLLLVPLDEELMACSGPGANSKWRIDGLAQAAFTIHLTSENFKTHRLIPEGKYIELEPGEQHRIYISKAPYLTSYPSIVTFDETIDVEVKVIPRYTSLRGND